MWYRYNGLRAPVDSYPTLATCTSKFTQPRTEHADTGARGAWDGTSHHAWYANSYDTIRHIAPGGCGGV